MITVSFMTESRILLKSDRCFSSTGEASNADEYLWLMGRAQYKPVIEYCGGTEIGGGFVSGSLLQPQSLAAFSTPAMGCTLYILAEDGNPIVCYFILSVCCIIGLPTLVWLNCTLVV